MIAGLSAAPADAEVDLFRDRNPLSIVRTQADDDGSYTFGGLDAGVPYQVCVNARDFPPADPDGFGFLSRCSVDAAWTPEFLGPPAPDAASVIVSSVLVYALPDAVSIRPDASATSGKGGNWRVANLAPDPDGYLVCFETSRAVGASRTGYLDQCYRNLPWRGSMSPFPAGTTAAPANPGHVTRNIDARLHEAGGLAGRIADVTTAAPIADATISVVGKDRQLVPVATTGADGRYRAIRLQLGADASAQVCFAASGFQPECYRNIPWSGTSPAPRGLTRVPLQPGMFARLDAGLTPGWPEVLPREAALARRGSCCYSRVT